MQIAILLYEGLTALDAVGPYEILSRLPGARVRFVAAQPGPIRTDSGMLALVADEPLSGVTHPEVLLVPGGAAGTFAATRDGRLLEWIRTADRATRWTTSVCSGALILGAAGLLREKQATTHWFVADRLSDYGATYVPHRIVEEGKIITAAGCGRPLLALRPLAPGRAHHCYACRGIPTVWLRRRRGPWRRSKQRQRAAEREHWS